MFINVYIICVYICLYVFIYVYMCLYMFIYKCIYIYIYICVCGFCDLNRSAILGASEVPAFLWTSETESGRELSSFPADSWMMFCSDYHLIDLIVGDFQGLPGLFSTRQSTWVWFKVGTREEDVLWVRETVNLWVPKLHDVWTILKSLILTPIVSHDCLL